MQNRIIGLLSSVILFLAATVLVAQASQYPASEDSIAGNSSYNNSSLSFVGQNKITSAPVDLTAGSGYYSSHPIAIGTEIGSRTQLVNGDTATSMSHEVGFAEEISGTMEYAATSRSIQGDYETINYATTQMRIDETVTNGKVDIGVLSGSDGHAWKNPSLEIEEEYIGTYHITKNFTINSSYSRKSFADGWLDYSGGFYEINPQKPALLSADEVFNCKRCNHISP